MIKNHRQFVPDERNLGGKKNIDSQSKNHLLALINIKPTLNTHKPPKKHVNANHYSNKQILNNFNEYKEVHEAFRRVKQLKHGGIDSSQPIAMKRQHMISKRIPLAKNIEMQDHQRNLKALLIRLDNVEKKHYQKADKIIKMNQTYNQSMYQSNKSIRSAHKYSFNNKTLAQQKQDMPFSQSNQNFYGKYDNDNILKDVNISRNYHENQQNEQIQYQDDDDYEQQQNYELQNNLYINDDGDYYQGDDLDDDFQNTQQQDNRNQYQTQGQMNNQPMDFSEAHLYDDNREEIDEVMSKQQNGDFTLHSNSIKDMSNYSTLNSQYYNNSQQKINKRPQSAMVKNGKNKFNIPFIPAPKGVDPYREIKRVLLNIVMDQNLFDKKIITVELPMQMKKQNPQFSRQKIAEICTEICYSLFGYE